MPGHTPRITTGPATPAGNVNADKHAGINHGTQAQHDCSECAQVALRL